MSGFKFKIIFEASVAYLTLLCMASPCIRASLFYIVSNNNNNQIAAIAIDHAPIIMGRAAYIKPINAHNMLSDLALIKPTQYNSVLCIIVY